MLEPVSRRVERGIESKYFDIHYRPGKESRNSSLDIHCSSLLTYLALADIRRDSSSFKKVEELFQQALSLCQTEEELRNLDTFLKEAAEVGGYAEEFYSEVSKRINATDKVVAEQTLQKETEEKQKAVSRRTLTGIESEYFGIHYRPGVENKNSKLAIHCSSLLTFLALADISRDNRSFKTVEEKFYEALLLCQTDEELRELSSFLREASDIGGYANQFYAENAAFINQSGKEKAEQYFKQTKEEKEKPVSRRIERGIESSYFDIEYRPGKTTNNFILEIEASSLLTYLALADIYRDEETYAKAQRKFFQVLASCGTEKEVQEIETFLKVAADIGGYANQFYSENVEHVRKGMSGVEEAKKASEEKENSQKKSENSIDDFNRRYSAACDRFQKAATSSYLDDEEIASLLSEFNELQGALYRFDGEVAKEFISETDHKLENQIAWLRNAYQTVEELKETFNI